MSGPTCEERIDGQLAGRLADFRDLLGRLDSDDTETRETADEERWNLPLSVELVKVVRVQMSWGGPADEFRVTLDSEGRVQSIEYRFQDWFDGATRILEGSDFDTAESFLEYFVEVSE